MPPPPAAPPHFEEQIALPQRHLMSICEPIAAIPQEIAKLHREQEVGRTGDELQAVVESTEQGAGTILTAAEPLDTLAHGITLRTKNTQTWTDAQAIQAQMQTVFEACNFEDLTCQRISKVVWTVCLVEVRMAEMLRLWVGSEATTAPAKPAGRGCGDELMNGPALTGTAAVSQDAVDALFG